MLFLLFLNYVSQCNPPPPAFSKLSCIKATVVNSCLLQILLKDSLCLLWLIIFLVSRMWKESVVLWELCVGVCRAARVRCRLSSYKKVVANGNRELCSICCTGVSWRDFLRLRAGDAFWVSLKKKASFRGVIFPFSVLNRSGKARASSGLKLLVFRKSRIPVNVRTDIFSAGMWIVDHIRFFISLALFLLFPWLKALEQRVLSILYWCFCTSLLIFWTPS